MGKGSKSRPKSMDGYRALYREIVSDRAFIAEKQRRKAVAEALQFALSSMTGAKF